MHDFESKKRQVLDRVDILALIGEHVALRRAGKRWLGLCPFHTEKTPSFTVSPEMGIFKCFGCGKGGDVFSFVQSRENMPFMEAMRFLADRAGISLEEPPSGSGGGPAAAVTRIDIARACAWAATFFHASFESAAGRQARDYITGRGFAAQTIEKFGLGVALEGGVSLQEAGAKAGFPPVVLEAADLLRRAQDGRYYETFRNRLMFPIRDAGGRVLGFGGRTLGDDKAKYLNTRQNALFDKGRTLFGLDLARQSIIDKGRAVIVEGYTDCMACHQAGFTETVASLGTALTESHVETIRRYAGELVLVFDSDQAGMDAADRALRIALPRSITVRLARVPEGKDPGDFLTGPGSAAAFMDLLKGAVEALEFTWRQTWVRYQAPTSDARRREAVLDFVRMVSEASNAQAMDAIRKGLLVNQLAHLLRIDRAEVVRLMASHPVRRPEVESANNKVRPAGPMRDAEQGAWTHLLEVLLNEPGLLGGIQDWPVPAGVLDARDRRIAEWVFQCARKFGEFALADILASAVDGDDAARIAELASRGQARGNYEATFQVALERIRQRGTVAGMDPARQELLEKSDVSGDDFASFDDAVRRFKHFGPLRLVRQAAKRSSENTTATTQVILEKKDSESI